MDELVQLILAFALGCVITGAIAKAYYLKRLAEEKVAQALFYDHMMKQINNGIGRLDQTVEAAYAGIIVLDKMLSRMPATQSLYYPTTKQH